MSEKLEITEQAVLEAAKSCPTARDVLKKLFPKVFGKATKAGDIYLHPLAGNCLIVSIQGEKLALCDLKRGFVYSDPEQSIIDQVEDGTYKHIGNLKDFEIILEQFNSRKGVLKNHE